ncbi:MAG: PAS domain S-box protein [Bacteroidetes bacterium]|nr:PAS domain S-box protein [Bacteroidota bacterium]
MTKILAIDDNPDNLIVIKAVLSTAFTDLTVITATTGKKGIELAESENPDVILLDLIMPDMDGYETCRILKTDKELSRIPVIILTALQTDAASRIKALKLGAELFLCKPVDETELTAQVTSMLRIKRSEDKLRLDNENLEEIIKQRTEELQKALILHEITEETLKASEERFRLIVKNSSDILVVINPDGIQRYISPAVERITGYSPNDLIQKSIADVIHPDDLPEVMRVWAEGIGNPGRLLKVQYRHIHKTKQWVYVEAVGQSFVDEPSVQGVITSVRDISERLEAERAKQRAATIQQIQYNIAHAVVTADSQNELFEVVRKELSQLMDTRNFILAQYDEQTGMLSAPFERDERGENPPDWSAENSLTGHVIKQKRSLFLKKADIKALADAGEIVLRGIRAEVWIGVPIKAGDKVTAAIVIQSYDNPDAYDKNSVEILEIIANQLNIYAERKRAEENEMKLSKALIQSPVSIVITDTNGIIEYVNPKICEITGYFSEELLGQNPRIFQSGVTSQETYQQLWKTILSGGEWRGEFQNKKKTGELFWESVSITPIIDLSGRISNFLAVKEDITERKKNIEELEKAKHRAEAGDRLKSAFLENISHEIRTPLNGILGFAPLVIDPTVTDDEKQEYLEILNTSGKRLIQTVTDYMDISLLVSGNMKIKPKQFAIVKLINELESAFKQRCQRKNLLLEIQLSEIQKNIILNTDHELLRKILFHLFDNAVKFTEKGGIKLECYSMPGIIRFTVKDTGIGINQQALPNIFDKFYQEETKLTRSHEGSGLGLTIVDELLKLLGGEILVESEKLKGSLFTISIPYESNSIEAVVKDKHENLSNTMKTRTIVIAEDDEDNFYFLKVSLRSQNFEILRAKNGQDAVDIIKTNKNVCLVLMDLKMPDLDGYEATKQIKAFRSDLPIIAVTAYAMSGDEEKTLEAGCDGYLPKPFSREQILDMIHQYITN